MAQAYLGMKNKLKSDDYKPSPITIFGAKERKAWIEAQEETLMDISEVDDSAQYNLPGEVLPAREVK